MSPKLGSPGIQAREHVTNVSSSQANPKADRQEKVPRNETACLLKLKLKTMKPQSSAWGACH